MDTSKKYIYINPGDSSIEDGARSFPVSAFRGAYTADATSMIFLFEDAAGDIVSADVTITSAKGKELLNEFAEAINFAKDSRIVLADNQNDTSAFSDVTVTTAAVVSGGTTGSKTRRGSNAVGTGFDSAEYIKTQVETVAGEVITTVKVDITGLVCSGTVKDIIGENDAAGAYLLKLEPAVNGVVYRADIACIETPAGSNCALDIDLVSNSSALAEDAEYDGSGTATLAIAPAANWAVGDHKATAALADLAALASDYIYLADGTGAASGGTYTAGKFVIKFYGCIAF